MNAGRCFLPGPTEVHSEVLQAMLAAPISHRSVQFEEFHSALQLRLRSVFRTTRPVYCITASASGAMEMAVRSAPPGAILCVVNGAFGERFVRIAQSTGRHQVHVVGGEWNRVVSLDEIETALSRHAVSAITVVHCETSTGIVNPVAEIAALARSHGVLSIVDAVTTLGGMPVEPDEWQLDFLLTGSQKALAMPAGISFATASEEFVARAANAPDRGLYLDVVAYDRFSRLDQTPNTPALPLLLAAHAQCRRIEAEGLKQRWQRHEQMAIMTAAFVDELARAAGSSFSVTAPLGARSTTVTTVTLPTGLSARGIVQRVAQLGYSVGAGYGALADTTLRIGHMGDHTPNGLARCLDACREAVQDALNSRTVKHTHL